MKEEITNAINILVSKEGNRKLLIERIGDRNYDFLEKKYGYFEGELPWSNSQDGTWRFNLSLKTGIINTSCDIADGKDIYLEELAGNEQEHWFEYIKKAILNKLKTN